MAKKATSAKTTENALPYVQMAAFCELVLKEDNGLPSVIRILDVLNLPKASADESKSESRPIQAIVALKSGTVKGPRTVRMFMTTPSGIEAYHHEQAVDFAGDGHGIIMHLTLGLQPTEEGLWWFEVQVDGTRVTRMPLQVIYQKSGEEKRETLDTK